MTIRLGFTINREIVHFLIEGKVIRYYDRKWSHGVQFMPKDHEFIRTIIFSRNRIQLAEQIRQWIDEANSGDNLTEYNACQTEEDIANIIRRDALKKGLVEIQVKT